jgi:hypothetical protein
VGTLPFITAKTGTLNPGPMGVLWFAGRDVTSIATVLPTPASHRYTTSRERRRPITPETPRAAAADYA